MSVYVKRNKKTAVCKYCGKDIKGGGFAVVALFYKRQNNGAIWKIQLKWHCNCWIKQGKEVVEEQELREPEIETRGRKVKLVLSSEQLHERKKIMMRRASIVCRIKKIISTESPNFDKVVRLGGQLDKCKRQIEEFGGVPKSWDW